MTCMPQGLYLGVTHSSCLRVPPHIFYFSLQKTPQIFNFQLVMGLQYFHNMNVFLIPIKFWVDFIAM